MLKPFYGGKRTNLSDIPQYFQFPLLPQPRKGPRLCVHIPPNKREKAQSELPKPLVDGLFEEILGLTKTVGTLQDENASLIEALKRQKI